MRFSGQQAPSDSIKCDIRYRFGAENEDLARLFIDALTWLIIVLLNARTHDLSKLPERKRWISELLLGYATLAVNEARALLLLLSGALHRNARVHLRSLYEFELRMCRLLDESANLAVELRDAYAYEARSLEKALGTDLSIVETDIAAALGVADVSGVRGGKEKDALGGNMREAMRDEPSPAKRYLGSVTWASQMSHGTVLTLREVAKATDGTSAAFFDAATRDALGNTLLYLALWPLLHFIAQLDQVFDTGLPPGADLDQVASRSDAINARLHIVSPEEEARGEAAVTEHAKRKTILSWYIAIADMSTRAERRMASRSTMPSLDINKRRKFTCGVRRILASNLMPLGSPPGPLCLARAPLDNRQIIEIIGEIGTEGIRSADASRAIIDKHLADRGRPSLWAA